MKSNPQKQQKLMKLFSVLGFILLNFVTYGVSDLASDRAILVALRNAVGGRTRLWNLSEASPCSWLGVTCNSNRVVLLRLPGEGLVGKLPLGLGNLTELKTLSLRFNALSGPVPSDLANLNSLHNLYLQGNLFTGPIPEFLFNMQSLIRLNLAKNNFSGDISPRFNNLTQLGTLYLEENKLSGSIPELDMPSLQQFNVSFNQLNGSVPAKLSRWSLSAFQGNSLCGKPLVSCNGDEKKKKKKKKLSGGAIVGIVIGCIIGFLIIVAILILLCRRKTSKGTVSKEITPKLTEVDIPTAKVAAPSESLSTDFSSGARSNLRNGGSKSLVFFGNAVKVFDLEDLLRASAEVLGKGTFGTTYKATMDMGITMAVKRLKEVTVPEKEFREKMEKVGRMNHENLVPLKGYYYSGDEKLLVYDYMSMGSLSALLHGNRGAGRTPLNWETRSRIALGAAHGVAYLHSQGPNASHGNIKSSNILLSTSYEARVSDFGLAHVAGPTSIPTRIEGYRAPEVTNSRKVSQMADVYSFGVLLLELLTGKPPTSQLNEEGVDLPRWVNSIVREEWTAEVFDLELLRYQNVEEDMVQLLQLAIECSAEYPDKRPSMSEVRSRIEEICQSSSQQEQVANTDSFEEADAGLSQQYYSTESAVPPPVKD